MILSFLQQINIESTMLDNDKLLVVLAVVLIIWIGVVIFLYRTDRKIDHLESSVQHLLDKQNSSNHHAT